LLKITVIIGDVSFGTRLDKQLVLN